MDDVTLDLQGLAKFAVSKAVEHAERKSELPLSGLMNPLIEEGMKHLQLGSIEIDPVVMAMGKVVVAGMQQQKKREEARRLTNVSASTTRDG